MNPFLEQRKLMLTGKKVLYEMIDELDDSPKSTMLGEYGALCVFIYDTFSYLVIIFSNLWIGSRYVVSLVTTLDNKPFKK